MPKIELSEPFLRALLHSIDQGIHAVDRRGVTIFYNDVAAQLDGLAPEEVLGRHLLEVFPSLSGGTSTLLRAIETGRPVYNEQQTFTNFKGHRVTTINSTLPIFLEGELVGALEVSKDITRVRELSEHILDLEAALGSSSRRSARAGGAATAPHAAGGRTASASSGARPGGHARRKSGGNGRAVYTFADLVGEDPAWLSVVEQAQRAARVEANVLVYGETGTGKELIVQSIHNASPRRDGPFIAQNCAALPASLLEGLLFGTVRGSFTGAEDRPGLFELAGGGTLLLDEINSMPLELQAKLLRTLQERVIRRVGDIVERPVDVRVIATTNADPHQAVADGLLRRDLFHRLQVVYLELPPLRARTGDLGLLIDYFLQKHGAAGASVLSAAAMQALRAYDWPGNVRELEHALEGALALAAGGPIDVEHLPPPLSGPSRRWRAASATAGRASGTGLNFRAQAGAVERHLIEEALRHSRGNVSQAARLLAMPRQTLQYRLRKLGLDPAAYAE